MGDGYDTDRATNVRAETLASTPPSQVSLSLLPRQTEPHALLASSAKRTPEPEMYYGRWPMLSISFAKTGLASNDPTVPHPAKDHLLAVHQVGDGQVALRFLDGFVGSLKVADLGLDTSRLRLGTIRAAQSGESAEVEDQSWHTISIDSSVLRAYVDPQYAAILKEAIAELR
jgi:hypothetical protein